MTPGPYEQVRDLTLNRKKFAPGTKVGLNDQNELVEVVASYKDWVVTNQDPVRLRNLLGSLIKSARHVNQYLNLSDRSASTLETELTGELDYSVLTDQVKEFLRSPACQIIRTREQLNKALQTSLQARKPEKNLQEKLQKEMHEGFSRFCGFMDTTDLNQLVGFYKAALLEWLDEFSYHCSSQGLDDVYLATQDSFDAFSKNLIAETLGQAHKPVKTPPGSPTPESDQSDEEFGEFVSYTTSSPLNSPLETLSDEDNSNVPTPQPDDVVPPSTAKADNHQEKDAWYFYGKDAQPLRELDNLLTAGNAESLESLFEKLRQNPKTGKDFLDVKGYELRETLNQTPEVIAKELQNMQLPLDNHLAMASDKKSKQADPLYGMIMSAARAQGEEVARRLPDDNHDLVELGLYLKYPEVIGMCKPIITQQLRVLIQLCPDQEQHFIEVARQSYLTPQRGHFAFHVPLFGKASREVLLLSDFTREEHIILEFIKSFPQAALELDATAFENALIHPELSEFWTPFITRNATRLSKEQWQALFSGVPPKFHEVMEKQLSKTPPMTCQFPSTYAPKVEVYLKANPELLCKALELPRKVESGGFRTLQAVARSLPIEELIELSNLTGSPVITRYLVTSLEEAVKKQSTIPLSSRLIHFINLHWGDLSQEVQFGIFETFSKPDPELTTEDSQQIKRLLEHNQSFLASACLSMDFGRLICSPWIVLPVSHYANGFEQFQGMVLEVLDQMPSPPPPEDMQQSLQERLNLTHWFRKHRHHLYGNTYADIRHPSIPKLVSTSPAKQLEELILFRVQQAERGPRKAEALGTLLGCAYSDRQLLEIYNHPNFPKDTLKINDKVFLSQHRGPIVAQCMAESFGDHPDDAIVEIGRAHAGIIPETQWRRLNLKAQLKLAERDPAIAATLLYDPKLPLPARAWIHAHQEPAELSLLDDWQAACEKDQFSARELEEWQLALEQLAVCEAGRKRLISKDFPWPERDPLTLKGRVYLKVMEQDARYCQADIVEAVIAVKKQKFKLLKSLADVLARHYPEIKTHGQLKADILTRSHFILSKLIAHSEPAALDFWPQCTDEEALKAVANKSLALSLDILESIQASRPQEGYKLPLPTRLGLIKHSPHPEIKRRLAFMELHNLLANRDISRELRSELDQRVEDHPLFKLIQQEEELFKALQDMVETGQGTPKGLLDEMEDCGEESLRLLLTPLQERKKVEERSLGFRTLLVLTNQPTSIARNQYDKLLSGAIKYEAIARKILEDKSEGMEAIRKTLGQEKLIKLIGPHTELCLEVMKSDKPFPISDATRLHWAKWHYAIAQKMLTDPATYLLDPDSLKNPDIVKMASRSADSCKLLMLSRKCKNLRTQLQPADWVTIATTQPEFIDQLKENAQLSQTLGLDDQQLLLIGKKSSKWLSFMLDNVDFDALFKSMSPDDLKSLAKADAENSGLILLKGFTQGTITEQDFLAMAQEGRQFKASVLKHAPEHVAKTVNEELSKKPLQAGDLPTEEGFTNYEGNLAAFSQGKDFGGPEIDHGCCAGFVIDFCLFCNDPTSNPVNYLNQRDQWKANRKTSDYMRKVRHYQRNQDSYSDKSNPTLINIDGSKVASSDPEASIVHTNGKRRLDVKALMAELRQHKRLYIASATHAVALTLQENPLLGDTLYLFDANHGLYRFSNFMGDDDQLDDVEALINDWLMKTGKGKLDVKVHHLQPDAYTTPGLSSPTS
ncbi:hypothetical protein [Endozoicomonas arenosclerae]|uniref:hypothetical protein n=1 Tax=Endozoicomonas arenosclerae TaxID=1633495 RepID=UPI0007857084|nr:hypothetical protein [Endozoicomonas arenosclerae]